MTSYNAPARLPGELFIGQTAEWTRDYAYGPDLWTARYLFANASDSFAIAGADDGAGGWLFRAEPAASALWTAGEYRYAVELTEISSTRPYIVERGTVTVLADPTAAADFRSDVKAILDAINALLAGKFTADVSSYAIGGRSLVKMTAAELLEARGTYENLYRIECEREAWTRGEPTGRRVLGRF